MTDWKKADDYRGFEIQISSRSFEFFIAGDDFAGQRHVRSFKAAKEAIDKHHTEEGKKQIRHVEMNVPVLDPDGEPLTITGLHRGTGRGKVASNSRKDFEGLAYPVVPWVRTALQERRAMQTRIAEINEQLHPLGVSIGASWSSQIAAERYAGLIERLKKELDDKSKIAWKAAKVEA